MKVFCEFNALAFYISNRYEVVNDFWLTMRNGGHIKLSTGEPLE